METTKYFIHFGRCPGRDYKRISPDQKPEFLPLDPPFSAANSFVYNNLSPPAQSVLKFELEIIRNKHRQKYLTSIPKFSTDGCIYNKEVN